MERKTSLFEADLHCHTTASDGVLSPAEVVCLAAELGLKALAITDHDTIHGWREAAEAGVRYHIHILSGLELSTDWAGKEVHILGYGMDNSSPYLSEKLERLREGREKRADRILERLESLGIKIASGEVEKFAKGGSIGRPHIAQALAAVGYVKDVEEAFDRYLRVGAPAYVPHLKLTPEEGIALIQEAGGVAVLAHPGPQRLEDGLLAWLEAGLRGIEVCHSEHTPADEIRYREVARKYGLIPTGGSDFHGETVRADVSLGGWGASLDIVREIMEAAGASGTLKKNS